MIPVPVGQNCLWAPSSSQVVLGLRVRPIRPEIPLTVDGKLRLQDFAVGHRTAVRTVQCFDFSVKSTGTGWEGSAAASGWRCAIGSCQLGSQDWCSKLTLESCYSIYEWKDEARERFFPSKSCKSKHHIEVHLSVQNNLHLELREYLSSAEVHACLFIRKLYTCSSQL